MVLVICAQKVAVRVHNIETVRRFVSPSLSSLLPFASNFYLRFSFAHVLSLSLSLSLSLCLFLFVLPAISIIIFQLGNEKLGLPVRMLQEVTHPCIIQPLPHRSNELFLGLVNIRGETLLCASLQSLLHIQSTQENINKKPDQETNSTTKPINPQRMIVAGQGEDKWVFPVDEVHGIFRFHLNELQDAPVVITKSEAGYTKGIVYWENKKVNYLDSDLLFYTLNHKIL